MKATVDANTCTGCELCCDAVPDVFVMDGSVAKVKVDEVPAGLEDAVRDAAANCPVQAIQVTE
ncbi:MAG: ferredoxin [Kiritimatiellae bacterium]|nr:ferredoxin [Kiritimatiellia bacterium]